MIRHLKRNFKKPNLRKLTAFLVLCTFALSFGAQYAFADNADDTDENVSAAAAVNVQYYVAINDTWQLISIQSNINGLLSGSNRHYDTLDTLSKVYGAYGFDQTRFNGEMNFAHTDNGDKGDGYKLVWTDARPQKVDGKWCIPLSTRDVMFVYYLPDAIQKSENMQKFGYQDETMLARQTFYTVTISDPTKTETANVGIHYVFNHNSYSVTLKKLQDRAWKIVNQADSTYITPDAVIDNGDTVTYTFNSVTSPIKISADNNNDYSVVYNASVKNSLTKLGQIDISKQILEQDGSINGSDTYEDIAYLDKDYRVLSIDDDRALIAVQDSGKNKKLYYHFQGWRVGSSDDILKPGQILTPEEVAKNELNGTVALNAVWSGTDSKGRIVSANFYINVNCEIADNKNNGFVANPASDFTKSVYTNSYYGTDDLDFGGSSNYLLLAPATEKDDAYEVDSILRGMSKTPYKGITTQDFPSDEDVLAVIRNSDHVIKVDGVVVDHDLLTTDHFKVRWYTAKYEQSDGWHIDGILVAKEAKLRIVSSFLGEQSAIADAKDNYYISITHLNRASDEEKRDNGLEEYEDYKLVLKPLGDESLKDDELGYKSYDESTNTYTWIATGRVMEDYYLEQQNYAVDDTYHHSNLYRIYNAAYDPSYNTNGWEILTQAAKPRTKVESYPNDVDESAIQTVEFRNTYAKAGYVTITKIDSFSNSGMKDVKFKINKDGDDSFAVYKKTTANYADSYSSDPTDLDDGYTKTDDNTIITSINGNIYIKLAQGTYTLSEYIPNGYDGAAKIVFTVDDSGIITAVNAYDDENKELTDLTSLNADGKTIIIKNNSKLLLDVKAVADWGETPTGSQSEVKVELWYNGMKMNAPKYTQVLNEGNDWTYTWNHLPLFVNGGVAQYTLHEINIGSTAYDASADTDGYRNYFVTYDPTKYRKGDTGDYGELAYWPDDNGVYQYADHALLNVHNRLDNGTALVFFSQIWEDNDNQDGIRPKSVTVKLYKNDAYTGESIVLNADNSWSGEFGNLRKYENGQENVYTIQVDDVDKYTTVISGDAQKGFEITSTHTPETVSFKVNKVWNDDNDKAGKRPNSITAKLLADWQETEYTKEITADDNWQWTFNDLPKNKDDGTPINYTLSEVQVPDYLTTITDNEEGWTINNTYNPPAPPETEKITISGTKSWVGDEPEMRPEKITVNLLANGTKVASAVVSADTDGNWKYAFADKDKFDEKGAEIVYTVSEDAVEDYDAKADGYNIINTYNKQNPQPAKITISGSKTWDDNDNAAGARPSSVTINLLADDEKVDSRVVTAANGWAYDFGERDKFKNGTEIAYTVTEDAVENYETTINGFDITNTYTGSVIPPEDEKVQISGAKTWDDKDDKAGKRPESIVVNLYRNIDGESALVESKTVTAANNWTYDFGKFPTEIDGKIINYNLSEEPVSGYTAYINGFNITNVYKKSGEIPQEYINVYGQKLWKNDTEDDRPDSITIHLLADGREVSQKTVTAADNWQWCFSNVPRFDKGAGIHYTFSEDEVAGYTTKIDENRIINTYVGTPVEPTEPANPPVDPDTHNSSTPDEPSVNPTKPDEPSVDPTPAGPTEPDSPVITPDNDNNKPAPAPNDNQPKTGDSSHVLLWSIIALMAGAGLVILSIVKKNLNAKH